MSAILKIIKYTGLSSIFGTEVSSLGLKRVDSAVPAVYGEPIVPGDDKSDILRYPVLIPDNDSSAYSFESIFKLHLKEAPDNQLSNIRIYPQNNTSTAKGFLQSATLTTVKLNPEASTKDDFYIGLKIKIVSGSGIGQSKVIIGYVGLTRVATMDSSWTTTPDSTSEYEILSYITNPNAPKLFIGRSESYTRPTNSKSVTAINNALDYTKENPYLITVGGLEGYEISPEDFQVYQFQATVGDTGSGNRFYLNGEKQDSVRIIIGNTYTFINSFSKIVRVATTANITLSAPQTIDGISVIAGDRVLVKNQTTSSENGIYVVAAGAWTRATDADEASDTEIVRNMTIFIKEGTANGFSAWILTTTGTITIDSTSLSFEEYEKVLRIYDTLDVLVVHADIVYSVSGTNQIITLTASTALDTAFPDGFKYGGENDPSIGSTIQWFDILDIPTETIEYDVEVITKPNGDKVYSLNDEKNPTLSFIIGKKYKFNNSSGDIDPFRIFSKGMGGSEEFVIVEGVTVTNGGTVNEVVEVDTSVMKASGKVPNSYQSTMNDCYGNLINLFKMAVTSPPTQYNMNTVGGGTDADSAGETDYIYLQVEIDRNTDVGSYIPNLLIEYDES